MTYGGRAANANGAVAVLSSDTLAILPIWRGSMYKRSVYSSVGAQHFSGVVLSGKSAGSAEKIRVSSASREKIRWDERLIRGRLVRGLHLLKNVSRPSGSSVASCKEIVAADESQIGVGGVSVPEDGCPVQREHSNSRPVGKMVKGRERRKLRITPNQHPLPTRLLIVFACYRPEPAADLRKTGKNAAATVTDNGEGAPAKMPGTPWPGDGPATGKDRAGAGPREGWCDAPEATGPGNPPGRG
jgi:hypothetical protein